MSQTRRLAAILAADVAGYSRLMGADEEGTLERLKALRHELLDPKIAEHHGRIVKTTGDGLLVEFASVVDAVRCAVAVQQAMPERNTGVAADNRIELRIGINLGDVIVEGDDPGILANAAQALASFGEDIDAMMALVDRALALNPNYARGWLLSGALRLWAGQPDIAIEHLETALRLSPRARVGSSMSVIGAAHFYARRFDEALPKLLLAAQDDPSYPLPYRTLAACYAHMGRLEDAREIVTRLRAITSVVIPDASYLRNAEHREFYLSGLRLAAGETT